MKDIWLLLLCTIIFIGCTPATSTSPLATDTAPTAIAPSATEPLIATPTPLSITGSGPIIETYKTIDGVPLEAHIFPPAGHAATDARPVFIFFHGGGWFEGQPENGYSLCRHFAALGMVAIAFEYRLSDSEQITPVECMQDARSAIRWTRQHAGKLGIDPQRIVATGGSASGHLALSTAILAGSDEPGEDLSISAVPNAMVVWSAPVELNQDTWFAQILDDRATLAACSPAQNVQSGLPPMALLHGTADETVPYWTVEAFVDDMQAAGNRCELTSYEDGGHLFHQSNRTHFLDTIETFLISLDYIAE